jgi:hypothetical protein
MQSTNRYPRSRSPIGAFPGSFRFYERSLDMFQFVGEGFGEAAALVFRFMVAVHEWTGRRLVW